MSDPTVATKAPESDAMEDQPLSTPVTTTFSNTVPTDISNTEPKQPRNPTISEHCTTDRPLSSNTNNQPSGELTTYHPDIATYISKPADYPSTPARLLLLLTNGRGVSSINNQLQADLFAQHGFIVVMPDMFNGDAAPNSTSSDENNSGGGNQDTTAPEEQSWLNSIKARVVETSKSFMIDMWLARQTPEKVLPIVTKVLDQAKEEFADAVAHGAGVYGVGYCFGGKYILTLAGERSDSVMQGQDVKEADVEEGMVRRGPEITCGVLAHGTLVTREDFTGIKAPVSLVCVENDPLFPEDILEFGKKELAAGKTEHEVKVYSSVPHGFAVVGEYESTAIKEAQNAAFDQMLKWLQAH